MLTGRKITERKYNKKTVAAKEPIVRVFSGRIKIEEPFFKIEANVYKWYVLVPKELLSTFKWNQIFRVAYKKRMIKRAEIALPQENLDYTSYDLENGSVLFAFK